MLSHRGGNILLQEQGGMLSRGSGRRPTSGDGPRHFLIFHISFPIEVVRGPLPIVSILNRQGMHPFGGAASRILPCPSWPTNLQGEDRLFVRTLEGAIRARGISNLRSSRWPSFSSQCHSSELWRTAASASRSQRSCHPQKQRPVLVHAHL